MLNNQQIAKVLHEINENQLITTKLTEVERIAFILTNPNTYNVLPSKSNQEELAHIFTHNCKPEYSENFNSFQQELIHQSFYRNNFNRQICKEVKQNQFNLHMKYNVKLIMSMEEDVFSSFIQYTKKHDKYYYYVGTNVYIHRLHNAKIKSVYTPMANHTYFILKNIEKAQDTNDITKFEWINQPAKNKSLLPLFYKIHTSKHKDILDIICKKQHFKYVNIIIENDYNALKFIPKEYKTIKYALEICKYVSKDNRNNLHDAFIKQMINTFGLDIISCLAFFNGIARYLKTNKLTAQCITPEHPTRVTLTALDIELFKTKTIIPNRIINQFIGNNYNKTNIKSFIIHTLSNKDIKNKSIGKENAIWHLPLFLKTQEMSWFNELVENINNINKHNI